MAGYAETRFRGTHNSYSGGPRGTIVEQLTSGVRWLELDFHAKGFAELGDFRVGHLKPGSEVELGRGNPDSLFLREWLRTIADWSDGNVHGPITLVLDSKDDLAATRAGGLEDLNALLETALGERLFTREDYDSAESWPDTAALRNRILCVLSGNGNTRASYRWAFGTQPAMAANAQGDVVLVYRSSAGDLNGFLGRVGEDGIRWEHKATYWFARVPLSQPAVAVNDDGWIVAAHRFFAPGFVGPRLESLVGRIGPERRVAWSHDDVFAIGEAPSVTLRGSDVRVVHAATDGPRLITGVLDGRRRRIGWRRGRRTEALPAATDCAGFAGFIYRCGTRGDGAILCGPEGELAPVRFRQLAFVEEQKGDDRGAVQDALFFAADAKDRTALAAAGGKVVRAWGAEETDLPCPAQVVATDHPRAAWYERYAVEAGALA